MKILNTLVLSLIFTSPELWAKKTKSGRTKANTPAEELAGFTVPEGFIIELVASEKDGIINPIDLTFDDAGRLWTQTARMYPLDPVKDISWQKLIWLMDRPEEQDKNPEFKRIKNLYRGVTKGSDEVLILSNLAKGQKVSVTKFATGLSIPQSILPYKSGAFIAQGSELFFLKDTNRDGVADKRIPVLTGFGFTDTHTMAHTLVRGPGGWINFSQGALNKSNITAVRSGAQQQIDYSKIARFSLDGKKVELVSSGLNNIWGFNLRHNGQWYGTEANDFGNSVNPMEPGTGFKGIGGERIRPYQPWMPLSHKFRVGGTGISGLCFADDSSGSFPEKWKDIAFLANPITSTINCVKIKRNTDGTVSAQHLPDLLTSKDDWFRPVNIEFGPDGCLYIADWYNKIVSHNELPTTHPDRDKSHGRIWRIRHKSQKPRNITNFYKVKTAELPRHILSPSLWGKRAAWHQIADRGAKELGQDLVNIAKDTSQTEITRIHALWSLESIHHYDAALIADLLKSPQQDLKREAVRSLTGFNLTSAQVTVLLKSLLNDPNVMVRSQVIRTLTDIHKADATSIDLLVSFCRPTLPGNKLGGSYERAFERFLARKALEQYPSQLKSYLGTVAATQQPASNLVWAMQALGKDAAKAYTQLWKKTKANKLNLPNLIIVSNMAKHPDVYAAVLPKFKHPDNAKHITELALSNVEDTYTPTLARLLQHPIENLLKSKESAEQNLGLSALLKFGSPVSPARLAPYLGKSIAIKALAANPKPNQAIFIKILDDPDTDNALWHTALSALSKCDLGLTQNYAIAKIKQSPTSAPSLVFTLAQTKQGTAALLFLLQNKNIEASDVNYATADRINAIHPKNPQAIALFKHAKAIRKSSVQAATKRIPSLIKLIENSAGNADIGKSLFTGMCLSCHIVGDQGANIAPALDGSAAREPEALLTAIINPDAAAEGAYVLYRVITKSGDITEGFLKRKNATGAVVASMGGNETFIPAHKIATAKFAGSRSFMPTGLISQFPDDTIAHLLAYIRTLK